MAQSGLEATILLHLLRAGTKCNQYNKAPCEQPPSHSSHFPSEEPMLFRPGDMGLHGIMTLVQSPTARKQISSVQSLHYFQTLGH